MKKILLTCFGIMTFSGVFAQGTLGAWVEKTSVPAAGRFWAMAFSVGGKGYAGSGKLAFSGSNTSDFWEYDPATDAWTQKANVPGGAKEGMDGFAIGDKGYAAFGSTFIQFESAVHQYDPATNTWEAKASVPGGVGFAYSHGFVIDSTYYIGPENGTNKFYAYNGFTNTWSQKANYPGGDRRAQVAFTADGKGYIGAGAGVFGGVKKDFFQYTPETDTWVQVADLNRSTDQSTAFGIGKYGYVYNVGGNLKETYRYLPALDEWQFEAGFSGDRTSNASSFVIGGNGYLVFGERTLSGSNPPSNKLWEFTPGILAGLEPSGLTHQEVHAYFGESGLILSVSGLEGKNTRVSLVSLQGQVIRQWQTQGQEAWTAEEPNLAGLASGVYVLQVQRASEQPLPIKMLKRN